MIPVDNFYNVLYANLLQNTRVRYFLNFTNTPLKSDIFDNDAISNRVVMHYDQEPIFKQTFEQIINEDIRYDVRGIATIPNVFANSEWSAVKDNLIREYMMSDWYYFYHGFAALDWYRDYKYFPKRKFNFDKVFMSLNHLITKDRSYRLNLVANYIEQGIIPQGIVSLPLADVNGTIKGELFDQNSKLSKQAKKLVYKNVLPLTEPFIADTEFPNGAMSAATDFEFQRKAFWHVVAETVFYYKKLHLTEKIFKPIIARRPFLLVAAPGNLAYLKSYGFKTFDRWVDESYDNEQDDDKRIAMVVAELSKLCAMSNKQLHAMYTEMDEILDFNFAHFYYGDFQRIIVDEMLDNFRKIPIPELQDGIDFDAVRERFLR